MKIYVDLDHVDITEYTQIESGEYNTNKINFIFTPEYKDLVKVAIFGCKLDTDEPKFYKIYLSDDSCYLPQEVTSTSDVISIGVYAFNVVGGELKLRYSPTPVKTIVYEGSFREEAENSSSPTPTEIEQIMSRIISLEELTSDLNTRVETLENKACDLDSIKTRVDKLEDDVENISGRVDTIESDIDDLEGDIANTYSKTEVDTLLGSKVDTSTFTESQNAQDEKIAKAELILSQLPKVTGEGTNFSLSPTIEYDLEVGSLLGDTSQEGTPTPETPIPIQVVTGTQEVEVVGKNILNLTTSESGGIDASGNLIDSGFIWRANQYIKVNPNTQLTFSTKGYSNKTYILRLYQYDKDKNFISPISEATNQKITMTTGSTTEYIKWTVYVDQTTLTQTIVEGLELQLEIGSTATTYSPYTSQTYTLHLGDEELAKIGSYQDKIYYDNGKWYLRKEIGKVTLNGSETGWESASSVFPFRILQQDKKYSSGWGYNLYSNYFKTQNERYDTAIIEAGTSKLIAFRYTSIANINDFKTWLSTHNTTVYYLLNTPSTTEITDDGLLQDLNYIKEHISSFPDTTNISTSGNLPIIITASALKQLS